MKKKINRWLAKNRLIKRYEYILEVNRLMEEFTTATILEGGEQEHLARQRQELLKIQGEMKQAVRFINFLRKI